MSSITLDLPKKKIAVLDNEQVELDKFVGQAITVCGAELEITPTMSINSIKKWAKTDEFDMIAIDQNLENGYLGIDLIQELLAEEEVNKHGQFLLYTKGALEKHERDICLRLDIEYADQKESFGVTAKKIEKILSFDRKMQSKSDDSPILKNKSKIDMDSNNKKEIRRYTKDSIFTLLKFDLIKKLEKITSNLIITTFNKELSIKELIDEVEQETEIGLFYLRNHIDLNKENNLYK